MKSGDKKRLSFLTVFFLFLRTGEQIYPAAPDLKINEFMALNVLSIADSAGEFDDWIEIFNGSAENVDLSGYYLTDDYTEPTKWRIPAGQAAKTTIPPRGYLLLWADDDIAQGPEHLGFRLAREKEQIALISPDGENIIDSLTYGLQYSDVSCGRYPQNSRSLVFFTEPTPGGENKPGYTAFIPPPVLSDSAGFFDDPVIVEITPDMPGDDIRYSLDGSPPSLSYTGPFLLDSTAVLSTRAWRGDDKTSAVVAQTMFFNTRHMLPVLALITDPDNLFSPATGIYANYEEEGRRWERKGLLQYFKDRELQFSLSAGVRIQGNSSVEMPKKSFRLFFREDYGGERLEYPIFTNTSVTSFRNLVLRAGYDEDITTPNGTLIRDPLITELWRRMGYLTSHSSFCVLYLNEKFWGIYDIRESINEHFVRDVLSYENPDIIRYTWSGWELKYGTAETWRDLLTFFETRDLSDNANFSIAAQKIDIKNYTDVHMLAHCLQYRSWEYGAFAILDSSPGARWQWTIWDMDRALTDLSWNGFSYYDDTEGQYWNNYFMKNLLRNEGYRIYYINRLADLLNTLFLPHRVTDVLDSLAAVIRHEIPAEAERWWSDTEKWEQNVSGLRNFISQRPDIVRQQVLDYFGLERQVRLTLRAARGDVAFRINSIKIDRLPWSGLYFSGVPIELTAEPKTGSRFVGWSDPFLSRQPSVTLTLDGDYELTALLEKTGETGIEIITPAKIESGSRLPIVVRMRDEKHKMDTSVNTHLALYFDDTPSDTSLIVKKGAGSGIFPLKTGESFTLKVQKDDLIPIEKQICVLGNYPKIAYSGSLPSGQVIWDDSAIRVLTDEVTVPGNTELLISAGTLVDLKKNVNLKVYGSFVVEGSDTTPVLFTSTEAEAWGGIELHAGTASFRYAIFVNGGGDSTKGWAHTNRQSIIFAYESSNLSMDNCFLLDSPGKAFGSRHSKIDISDCLTARVWHGGEFHNTLLNYRDSYIMDIPNDDHVYHGDEDNDALHIDYVNPLYPEYSTIDNCFFITGKDDAIDHHASRLVVSNCWIEDWMHEGVAASGEDTIRVFNTVVKNTEQGIECGWYGPEVYVDHCVVVDCKTGLRYGDSYDWGYWGHLSVANTVLYENDDDIRNFTNDTQGPQEGAIAITHSLFDDADYNDSPRCLTGEPLFDRNYYLLPGSPGLGGGTFGTNMGRIDSAVLEIGAVVINEIMYKPSELSFSDDWIELYNPQAVVQDLSGWELWSDSDRNVFGFSPGTVIGPHSFLVVVRDSLAFNKIYPLCTAYIGDFAFDLTGSDQIGITNSAYVIIDSISYRSDLPWPDGADGTGYSLSLRDYTSDNSKAVNWTISRSPGGSPGSENFTESGFADDHGSIPRELYLEQNYPNPFNAETKIEFGLPYPARVSLSLFNILGQEIKTVIMEIRFPAGRHIIGLESSNLSTGVYFYRLQVLSEMGRREIRIKKLLLLR